MISAPQSLYDATRVLTLIIVHSIVAGVCWALQQEYAHDEQED